jgi:hypothetical protein
MRQPAVLPDLGVTAAGEGWLILAGAPGRLRGQLHVTNAGARPSSLRGFAVRASDLPERPAPGQLGVRLAADTSSDVTASLELPAGTPPGEYHATLDVAGHEVEAVLLVSSDPALDLTPSRVFLRAGTTPVQLVLHNTGNVRLQVAPTSRARLGRDPDLTALPTDRSAPRAGGDDAPGPDAVLRVADPPDLQPGETRVVDAVVEVDGDLDHERRYLALLPVATATLRVIVNPAAPAPKATTRATPRRAKKAAPPRRNDA